MKFPFKFCLSAALAVILIFSGRKVEGQGFGLSVTTSANSILVSNNMSYAIILTNLVGVLPAVTVTSTLPTSVQFLGASPPGTFVNNSNLVIFSLGGLAYGATNYMTISVEFLAAGLVTNVVVVASPNVTNTATANAVVLVTNPTPPSADLGVAITAPTVPVIVNDFTTYGVMATNLGPNDAPNVSLTNTLPAGIILKGISPSNQSPTISGSNYIFNLGTLTAGSATNLQFSIQPTNAGVLNLFASVGAPDVMDTNTANNTASNTISVINYLPGSLVAVTNSAQTVNFVNGLIEQSILLSNVGTNDVGAARVVVTGLTNRLFNASGTNNNNPFVVYAATLPAGQSISLLLQYAPRLSFIFSNSQLQAFAVPMPDLSPPLASISTNLVISRVVPLANGEMLIEFPVITNRTYTVVYSDDVSFSNAMIAPPSILATASREQWIDYGPPATVPAPTNTPIRFYRVILNP